MIGTKYRFVGTSLGGPVVKNPSCKAGDNADSVPRQAARIPHATGQLSPCITTTELPMPQLETLGPCNERQRKQWHPTPVLLPGKSHGQRGLVGCSPWGHEESDTTEGLHFHFSLSCTGGGNGNPLQCCCLENPRDRGAWWAAGYGVA